MGDLKGRILLFLLGGYLILDYAFMQLRVPPTGFGIPLGELFLVFALLTTNIPVVLGRMGTVVSLIPFLAWWTYGFGRLAFDSLERGFWSFRDATQVIESLYLIVGFSVAGHPANLRRFVRWVPIFLIMAAVYCLGFPMQMTLIAISPKLYGASNEAVAVFGTYGVINTILLLTAFYFLIKQNRNVPRIWLLLAAYACIAFAIIFVQQRTVYLQLVCVILLLLCLRRDALVPMGFALPAVLFALMVITTFDLRVSGRLTEKITMSFLWDHIQAIFGTGADRNDAVGAAAQGVSLRYSWWEQIYNKVTSDAVSLLSGLGYGIPLTDFFDDRGTSVREPHNSYISVVGRLGLIGMVCWLWVQLELVKAWVKVYHRTRRLAWSKGTEFLLLCIAFSLLLLANAMGEDAMEKPYLAIPYYALWGVCLRISFMLASSPLAKHPVYPRYPSRRIEAAAVHDESWHLARPI
jgi:hypothetical protein